MSDKNSDTSGKSRRGVLKSAAAAGALSIAPNSVVANDSDSLTKVTERGTPEPTQVDRSRTVTIQSRGGEYQFSVTGALSEEDAPSTAVQGGTAAAEVQDGTHTFTFSGQFTEFDVDGNVEVLVDGEPFDVDAFPRKSLTIFTRGETEIDISASGRIESTDNSVENPNPRTVTGTITGRTTFAYEGQLTYFDVEGSVLARKNGSLVRSENVLPSSLPGEVQIGGASERVIINTSDRAEIERGLYATAESGTINARPAFRSVIGRFDGNIESIEHESGATVEFRPSAKRIVCTAPEGASASFEVEASEAVVYDREAHSTVRFEVDPGATEKIKYFGHPNAASIGGVDISFDSEAYQESVNALKLQEAAKFERTTAYERIEEELNGRVRHDAESLYYSTVTNDEPWEGIVYQTTDLEQGDRGVVSIGRDRQAGNTLNASYETQWMDQSNRPTRMEVNRLQLGGSVAAASASFETQTIDVGSQSSDVETADTESIDIFEGAERADRVDTSGVEPQLFPSLPSIPSIPGPGDIIDYFGDKLDDFSDSVGVAKETAADIISGAVENAYDTTIDDVVIKAGGLLVDSQQALIEMAAEAEDKLPTRKVPKFMMKITPGFASTLIDLGASGALEELASGNYGCAGCTGTISVLVSVGLAATASGTCAAISLATAFTASVACAAFVGVILEYGYTVFAPDAMEICSNSTFSAVSPCS